jgi:hypothetical protein
MEPETARTNTRIIEARVAEALGVPATDAKVISISPGSAIVIITVLTRSSDDSVHVVIAEVVADPSSPLRRQLGAVPGSVKVSSKPHDQPLQFYALLVAPCVILLAVALVIAVYRQRKAAGKLSTDLPQLPEPKVEVRGGRLYLDGLSSGASNAVGYDAAVGHDGDEDDFFGAGDEPAVADDASVTVLPSSEAASYVRRAPKPAAAIRAATTRGGRKNKSVVSLLAPASPAIGASSNGLSSNGGTK